MKEKPKKGKINSRENNMSNTTMTYTMTSFHALFTRATRSLALAVLPLAAALCLVATPHLANAQAPTVLYVHSASTAQTTPQSYTTIPGPLKITLPALVAGGPGHALITLDLPAFYTEAPNSSVYPGAVVEVALNGFQLAFGEVSQPVGAEDRTPITIVVLVPLTATTQTIEGKWLSVNSSKLSVGGFGSLSAILVQ